MEGVRQGRGSITMDGRPQDNEVEGSGYANEPAVMLITNESRREEIR